MIMIKSWQGCERRSMQPKKKISYSPTAVDDMDGIFSYITGENAPAAGQYAEKIG
ncbi:type II toxin-antitoxin system RelE/ParE family toxin [Paenibacillus sinopodophylli]|uniref:type II toxin-antitoxin system RelE/ParE family toxin n=1 Tax=Paenibacillus sinopodophylli TaxID=1837342 RepID=UPI0014872B17|nr:type II toxin-antitoxin system RelE/ParE family toxin [Paenibacillus sinopodophylli]